MIDAVRVFLSAVLPFLFVLPLVVVIHELGHFMVAKAFGVKIDRFSINFGAPLVKWRDRSGVEWRIGWIPLGGYVKFAGDENAASVPDRAALDEFREDVRRREGPGAEAKYFHFKPIWQRALITVAGPVANFLLAIVLFSVLIGAFGDVVVPPRIASVQGESPAARAGFVAGDLVVRMDGRAVDDFGQIGSHVMLRTGVPIAFDVRRGERLVALTVTPERRAVRNRLGEMQAGVLGITADGRTAYRRHYDPLTSVAKGTERTFDVLGTTLTYLGRVVTGRESADQLSGPLGIGNAARVVAEVGGEGGADFGQRLFGAAVSLLGLAAVISVGLGFMNLLPVPVLDGGHLVFYAYEAVAKRPLAARAQELAYRAGLAMLLGLMLFATWNDLQRLRVFQVIGGLFS